MFGNYMSQNKVLEARMLIKEIHKLKHQRRKISWTDPNRKKFKMLYIRYGDDWVLITNADKGTTNKIKALISEWLLTRLKLTLLEKKTFIRDIRKHSASFLGFNFINNLHKQKQYLKDKKKNAIKKPARDSIKINFNDFYQMTNLVKGATPLVEARDKVSLLVLFLTGVRIGSLLMMKTLQLKNLYDPQEFEVPLNKTNVTGFRRIFIVKQMHPYIEYLKPELELLMRECSVSEPFVKINRSSFTQRINKHLRKFSGLTGKNIKSHSFRITVIDTVIQQEGIYNAQQYIHHKDIASTGKYARTKLNKTKIKQINTSLFVDQLKNNDFSNEE